LIALSISSAPFGESNLKAVSVATCISSLHGELISNPGE
jgi:hypothetical protein